MGKFHKIKNLTPHQIKILLGGGAFTFDPGEQCARIIINEEDPLMGIPFLMLTMVRWSNCLNRTWHSVYCFTDGSSGKEGQEDLFFPLGLVRDEQTHIGCSVHVS